MPVLVVDMLEVVQIEHDHRHQPVLPLLKHSKMLLHVPAVVKAGQGILQDGLAFLIEQDEQAGDCRGGP
ncbi:hypothetical protein SDC9_186082 [bioreactor metagenome]|uniref:Uncharacterized protein n=1 Tax=bioreactor metagenome TaxID=1076179 RepID=A0A645HHP4_9ZZZZ